MEKKHSNPYLEHIGSQQKLFEPMIPTRPIRDVNNHSKVIYIDETRERIPDPPNPRNLLIPMDFHEPDAIDMSNKEILKMKGLVSEPAMYRNTSIPTSTPVYRQIQVPSKDEQPTVHEGSQARNLELQGIKADRCELNRQIRADNKLLRELKAQLAKLSKAVENTVEHIAETLERLRSSLIMLQYRLLVNNKQVDTWKRQVNYYRPILQDYHAVTQQLADKKSEQEQLQTTRNTASLLQIAQRRQLAEQIAALTEKIEELRSRQAMILHNLDCKNNGEAQRFGSYLDKLEEMQEKLAAQRESLTQQLSATIKQYLEIENMIQPEDEDSVRQRRTALRPDVAFEREQQLSHNGYIDNISIQIAQQIVDVQIVGDKISEKVQTSMAQHKEVPDR